MSAAAASGHPGRPGRPRAGMGSRGAVVIGMHRSGSSAVTRVIDLLGLPVAAEQWRKPSSKFNPTGFWEVPALTAINDEILRAAGGGWASPPPGLASNASEAADPAAGDELEARARATLRDAHPGTQWVWKDPRTSLTLGFWRRVLDDRCVTILVHRDPLATVASLGRRDGLTQTFGLALWERYMRSALAGARDLPTFVVDFSDLVERPACAARALRTFLTAHGFAVADPPEDRLREFLGPTGDGAEPGTIAEPGLSDSQQRLAESLAALVGAHDRLPEVELPPETELTGPLLHEADRLLGLRAEAEARHLEAKRRAITLKQRVRQLEAAAPPAADHVEGSDPDDGVPSVPLRLVMTLLLSDEEELVEPCLDYHLARGVDFAVVTVNRATEAVLARLAPYVDRGLVELIHEPAHTYAQSEWVTRMARLAATEHGADWVINCDPDEFYWPQGGSLKEILATIPEPYGSLHMAVCHFPPRPREDDSFLERMTVREIRSLKPGIPVQFAKVAHRATADVVVGRGNHNVSGPGLDPLPAWRPILGLHFPLRSYEQFKRKVIRDGEAVANNPDRKISEGVWRDLYELYRAGRLRDDYAGRVLDDAAVCDGLEAGWLVSDERLRDFFRAGLRPAVEVGSPADGGRVRRLGRQMRRAIREAEREPAFLEIQRLAARLERVEAKRDAAKKRAKGLEVELAEAKAKAKAKRSKRARKRRRRLSRWLRPRSSPRG